MARRRNDQYGQFSRQVTLDSGPITLDQNLDELTLSVNVTQAVMRVGSLAFMIGRFDDTVSVPSRTSHHTVDQSGLKGVYVSPASAINTPAGSLWVSAGPEIAKFGHQVGYANAATYPLPGISISRQLQRGQDSPDWPLVVRAARNLLGEDGNVTVTTPDLEHQVATDESVAGGTNAMFTYGPDHELIFSKIGSTGTPMVVELTIQLPVDLASQN